MPKKYRKLQIFNNHGFTMVELLVVITIIAILTTIAISTYSIVQVKSRDSKRRSDIDEIRKALELNYVEVIPAHYVPPSADMFGDELIPKDPKNTGQLIYSICTVSGTGNCSAGSGNIVNQSPDGTFAVGASFNNYVVCSKLEGTGGNSSDNYGTAAAGGPYYCKRNTR